MTPFNTTIKSLGGVEPWFGHVMGVIYCRGGDVSTDFGLIGRSAQNTVCQTNNREKPLVGA